MQNKILIIVCLIICSCSPATAQSSGKDERAFKSLIKQMTDAQQAFDAAELDKIFSADYIEVSPLGDVDQRKEVLGYYSPQAKAASKLAVTIEAVEYSIRSYDKFGIAIVQLNFTIANDGKPLPPRSVRVMVVFKKEKDLWKIASTQYTGIRQQPQQPQKTN